MSEERCDYAVQWSSWHRGGLPPCSDDRNYRTTVSIWGKTLSDDTCSSCAHEVEAAIVAGDFPTARRPELRTE